jgi:spore cortex formation protein SpoVR/YcgB (stage V sporulation)
MDNAVASPLLHRPPNLWVNEGLATYYENMSLNALPEDVKSKLDINVNKEFALLFNRYLYMLIKEPFSYGFAPMDEGKLVSNAAAMEFLHYTVAPLHIKAFDNEVSNGKPETMLSFILLYSDDLDNKPVAIEAAKHFFGDEADMYYTTYFLNTGIPKLWELKSYLPPQEEILDGLNEIEAILGSWIMPDNEYYITDIVSQSALIEAMENIAKNEVSFIPAEMSRRVRDYSPELYALLNDYYYKAQQKGLMFDDPDLRSKVLGE